MTQATDGFDRAVTRAIEVLQAEGFGVLANTDVEITMLKKLDVEGRSYRILGAGNPPLAHRTQGADPNIVMLLPYNLFVREEADGHITIGIMNPVAVLQLTGNLANGEIVQEVRGRLAQVSGKLAVSLDPRNLMPASTALPTGLVAPGEAPRAARLKRRLKKLEKFAGARVAHARALEDDAGQHVHDAGHDERPWNDGR